MRDFALVSSARFQEWTGEADGVKIRVVAPPEHAFYAKGFVDIIEKSIPIYNQWFGPYPGTQFTIVEGCFGWNGNQCGGLVLIDDRMFNMPANRQAAIRSTSCSTSSAINGGTTPSAPTVTPKPGWRRRGHLFQPSPRRPHLEPK